MMHVYSEMEQFETLVLYPEKFPNWYQILNGHSLVFINMSKEEYELEKVSNPILEEFIKINTGREPIPLAYHFENIAHDFSTVLNTPRAVYFLNITKEKADKHQKEYGQIIQGIDGIDDSILRKTYYRNLPINTVCNANGKNGWQQLLDIDLPPVNSIVISDNFLFANEDGIRGTGNVIQLIKSLLPDKLNTEFHVLLIAQEHKDKNKAWCNKLTGDIITSLKNLNKSYKIIFELVFSTTIHKRIAISNYFTITPDKGFAIFKSGELRVVQEDTEIQVDQMFHRINKNEGDTEFDNAEHALIAINKICKTIAEYVSNRPNDKNYRIIGDCNPDKSLKNRLLNDV